MKELIEYFEKNRNKKFLILSHHNSDADAISSSICLRDIIKKKYPDFNCSIGVAKSANKFVRELFDVDIISNPDLEEYDEIIVVDTGSMDQLSPLKPDNFVLIDHHVVHPDMVKKSKIHLVDPNASSTAEIIYELSKEMNVFDENILKNIVIGIMADTGHLRFSTPRTLKNLAEILEKTNCEIEDYFRIMDGKLDVSQRIAHIKASKRAKITRNNDILIATSFVSAFESSAARALLSLGADIAFVASKKEDEIRVSGRTTGEMIKRGVNLAEIMKEIGDLIEGSGGGHPGAAGANGVKGEIEGILDACVNLTLKQLDPKSIASDKVPSS
ncbi:MAG: bifunctional oligoribonuclease/PAP phosphatase NrnA [Candidatus Hydrothermarchaeota archaeon]